MNSRKTKRQREPMALVVTPAMTGGSWISIQRALSALADRGWNVRVVGLGPASGVDRRFSVVAIPFPRYDRHGWLTHRSRLIGFLWNLPLLVLGITEALMRRPKVVIHNGFTSGLTLGPAVRRLGCRSAVMYHGYVEPSAWAGAFTQSAARAIDLVVVNSLGSKENVVGLVPADRVVVNEHCADEALFELALPDCNRDAPLHILYVGRLDPDKLCHALVQAARDPRTVDVRFAFAGVGAFESDVKELAETRSNVEYLGYVSDRAQLIELYAQADVVWSYGDDSYLALPAVEALAAGRPVIAPRLVAIPEKAARGVTVDERLLPNDAGWFVDTDKPEEVVELLARIGREGVPRAMPAAARACALARYSPGNLQTTVEAIARLQDGA